MNKLVNIRNNDSRELIKNNLFDPEQFFKDVRSANMDYSILAYELNQDLEKYKPEDWKGVDVEEVGGYEPMRFSVGPHAQNGQYLAFKAEHGHEELKKRELAIEEAFLKLVNIVAETLISIAKETDDFEGFYRGIMAGHGTGDGNNGKYFYDILGITVGEDTFEKVLHVLPIVMASRIGNVEVKVSGEEKIEQVCEEAKEKIEEAVE